MMRLRVAARLDELWADFCTFNRVTFWDYLI